MCRLFVQNTVWMLLLTSACDQFGPGTISGHGPRESGPDASLEHGDSAQLQKESKESDAMSFTDGTNAGVDLLETQDNFPWCESDGAQPYCGQTLELVRTGISPEVAWVVETRSFDGKAEYQYDFACAADAFLEEVESTRWIVSVLTADVGELYDYQIDGAELSCAGCEMVGRAGPIAVDPDCQVNLECSGSYGQLCELTQPGDSFSNQDDQASQKLFWRIMVNGCYHLDWLHEYHRFQMCATDLEVAFRYAYDQIQTQGYPRIREVIVYALDANYVEPHICKVQLQRVKKAYLDEMRTVLGPSFTPTFTGVAPDDISASSPTREQLTWCEQSMEEFYAYFFNFIRVRVHVFHAHDTPENVRGVRGKVALQTQGLLQDLADMGRYVEALAEIGSEVLDKYPGEIAKPLCLPKCKDLSVDRVEQLHFLQAGEKIIVPRSQSDGYAIHLASNCLVFSGSWQQRLGKYEITFTQNDCQ